MRRPWVLVMVPVVLLGLAGCASGLSHSEADACRAVHAWDTGGRDADRFDMAVASATDALEGSEHDELVAAAEDLASSPEADRVSDVGEFLSLCAEAGWELPEG